MEKKQLIEWLVNGTIQVPKILLLNYSSLGLIEEEVLLLIHVHDFILDQRSFPTPDELSERMTLSPSQCANHLRRLIQRGFLKIEQESTNHVYSERYSLEPLWEKLLDQSLIEEKGHSKKEEEDALYSIFEKEFGRPLSPIECETLAMWIDQDHHSPSLIAGALRESVISGKLNFRYIDRILFDWQKHGIKSLEEAKAHGERVRGQQKRGQTAQRNQEPQKPIQMYNWLEDD